MTNGRNPATLTSPPPRGGDVSVAGFMTNGRNPATLTSPPRGGGDVSVAGFLPFVIQLETRDPLAGLPRRWPLPALDNGPHLSYAIQWFSFAVIALVGTAVLIRRGR